MDKTVDRDSEEMRSFARFLEYFGDETDFYSSDLRCNCSAASDLMRDQTSEEALSIIVGLAEDIIVQVYSARELAERLRKSAELVEQSDECI